jgi:hypothetical protein
VGGLVGQFITNWFVSRCYSTGAVTGKTYVGGFAGNCNYARDCYSTGVVTGGSYVGGFAGKISCDVLRCYAVGAVTGNTRTGGFVGDAMSYSTVSASGWDVETSGLTISDGGIGWTTAQMTTAGMFTAAGWDFVDTWAIEEGVSYPYLQSTPWEETLPFPDGVGVGIAVTELIPSQGPLRGGQTVRLMGSFPLLASIGSAEAAYAIFGVYFGGIRAPFPSGVPEIVTSSSMYVVVPPGAEYGPVDIEVVSDVFAPGKPGILLNGYEYASVEISSIEQLQVIGNDPSYPLDGDYVLLQDIDASGTAGWNGGLGFDPIGEYGDTKGSHPYFSGQFDGQGHVVYGLTINRPEEDYVGLFAHAFGAEIRNIGLKDANITGRVNVGGIVGLVEQNNTTGSISRCFVTGAVTGSDFVGGLVGRLHALLSESYAAVSVTGGNYVGGLVGENGYGWVSDCYATGAVAGGDHVGGLIGINTHVVERCYSVGTVTGETYIGGLVGQGFEQRASFWDVETSGLAIPSPYGGTGLTTAQMIVASTFTAAGWDFVDTWAIEEGVSYPYLLTTPWEETLPLPGGGGK